MCVDGPDTSGQAEAARLSAETAKRQLDMQEKLIPYYMARQEKLDALTEQSTNVTMGVQRQAAEQGKDMFDYSVETFRPVEKSVVAQAMADSMPDSYARYAGAAAARTGQTYTGLQKAAERNMRSMGVNPNSTVFASANRQAADTAALAGAASFNSAYDAAENKGYARKLDAAGLGRGLAGASAGAYGVATGAGSAATGSAAQASQVAGATIGTATQWGQLANSSMGNAISANGSLMSAPQGGIDPAVGQMAGMGAMLMLSDKNTKEKFEEVDGEEVLRGISRQRPQAWSYKPEDAPGGDTETHIGEMAQGVRRTLGEKAAPGGKVIDLRVAGRNNHAAIMALLDKVSELEAAIGMKGAAHA
jgi:hypothetical protein